MNQYTDLTFEQQRAYNATVSRLSQAGIYVYLSGVVLETVDGAIMSTMPAMVAAIQAGKTPDQIVSAFTAYAAANGGPYVAFGASHDGGATVWGALNKGEIPTRPIPIPTPNRDPMGQTFDLAEVVKRIPLGITYRGNYAYTDPDDLARRLAAVREFLAVPPDQRGPVMGIEDNMLAYGVVMGVPGFELSLPVGATRVDPQSFAGVTLAAWLDNEQALFDRGAAPSGEEG